MKQKVAEEGSVRPAQIPPENRIGPEFSAHGRAAGPGVNGFRLRGIGSPRGAVQE